MPPGSSQGHGGGKRPRTSSMPVARRSKGWKRSATSVGAKGSGYYNRQLAVGFTRFGTKYVIEDDGNGSIYQAATLVGWQIGNASGDRAVQSNQFGISANFQLSSLPDYAELTNLFDTYRLDKIELHINYLNNTSTAGAFVGPATATLVSGTQIPTIIMAPDKDDSNIPANIGVLQEYGSAVVKRMDKPIVFTVYPRVAKPAFQAGVFTGYTQGGPTWVDAASPAVEHYGFKAWVSEFPTSAGAAGTNPAAPISILEIQPKYFFSCKQTH